MLENNNEVKVEETENLEELDKKEKRRNKGILIFLLIVFLVIIISVIVIAVMNSKISGGNSNCNSGQTCPINLVLPLINL